MDFNMSLLEAVRSEDLKLLKTFMQNRVYNINECDEDGVTCLHIAAGLQDDTILQYLLEQGACIDCVTSDGLTPLHIAAMWGRSNHVHTLLSYGAKHYLKDSAGDDAYMHALKSKEVGSELCSDLISSHIASLSLIDSSDTEYLDKNLSKEKGSELFITACESPELNKTPVVTHEIDLEKLNSSPWITPRRKDRVKVRKFRMKDGQENRELLYDNQENGVNSFTQDESLNFFRKNGNFSQSDKILQNDQNVGESSKVEFDDYLTEMSLDLLSSSGCSDSSERPTFSYSTITCMETQRLYGSEMDDLGDVSRSFMSEFLTEWSSAEEGAELFTGNGKQYEDMVEQEMERNRKDNDGEGLGEQGNDKQDGRGNWKEEEEEEKVRGGGHGEGAGGEGGKKEEEDDVDVEKEEEEDVDVDEEKEQEQEEEKQQDDDVVKEEEDSKEEREEKQNGCHCEKEKKQKEKKNGRREDQVRVKENENKANGNYSYDNPLNSTFIVTPRCDDFSKKATNFFVPFQNTHADSDAFRRKTETTIVYDWKDCSSRETEESVAIPDSFRCASSEEIKKRIISFGQTPGPITPSTREVYLKKLWKLEHGHGQKNTKQNTLLFVRYPSELRMILTGRSTIPDCHNLEDEMMKEFYQSNKSQWRGGKEKSSFNYLLLDPRVSCNLPMRFKELSSTEAFRIFVLSVFYVGKGKRSRPYAHFHEAIKSHRTGKTNKKLTQIWDIWNAGLGVISLLLFQSAIPVEAFTREACMVEALGLSQLTNQKRGEYYGLCSNLPLRKKRNLGIFFLNKAFQIFIQEGERQVSKDEL